MKEGKMYLISKIFNNESIRTIWDSETQKNYISVVDVIGALTGNNYQKSRNYWKWLKNRLNSEGSEVVSKTNQLKLKTQDGKYRLTDVCDIEGMFRIIESIPSKNAEPIKQWLAKLGSERIDETFAPSLSLQKSIDLYRAKGYDEVQIAKRIRTLQERKSLTDVWQENGVSEPYEYAILTNEIYKSWSGMTSKEYKAYKGLKKESLRDNMDNIELILTNLSEEATKRIATKKKPKGLNENIKVAQSGGNISKVAKEQLESQLEESVISSNNKLNYEYADNKRISKRE